MKTSYSIMYTIELTDLTDLTKSLYTTEQLRGYCNVYKTLTYNKIILTNDLLKTTTTDYYGYYYDSYDTTWYQLHIDTNGLITKSVFRRVAKRVDIEEADSGVYTLQIDDGVEYFLKNVTNLTITYPDLENKVYPWNHFECWIFFSVGSSISVTFPQNTKYIKGEAPTFETGYGWEISIKDGVAIAMPNSSV